MKFIMNGGDKSFIQNINNAINSSGVAAYDAWKIVIVDLVTRFLNAVQFSMYLHPFMEECAFVSNQDV